MSIFDQIGSAFASDFVSDTTVNPQYQPPQRTWVGLTDEERKDIELGIEVFAMSVEDILKEAEAKLKQKNT